MKRLSKKYSRILVGVLVLLGLLLMIGVSYAYYYFSVSQSESNIVKTECFQITLTDKNPISLQDTIPLSDEEGAQLTPYEFTIKNVCNIAATYYVNIEKLDDSTLDELYLKYKLDNNAPEILGSIEDNETIVNSNAVSSRTIEKAVLLPNEEKTYNLRLWIDYDSTVEQSASKVYSSKVVVTATINKNPFNEIALNYNGGEESEKSISIIPGRVYGDLPTPSKKGYLFMGWYTTPSFDIGTGVGNDSIYTTGDNLYARFIEDTFKLSIDPNGGEYNSSPGIYETNITYKNTYELGNVNKEGYTFINWNVEFGEETSVDSNIVTMGNEDAYIKANYSINKYTLSVKPNGGTWSSYTTDQIYQMEYHSTMEIPNPIREGYTFTGWSVSGGNLESTTFTIGASDAELVANWQVNDYKWIVYHNKMNVSGLGYTLADTENGHGNYGLTFSGTLKNYTGFQNPIQASKTIAEDVKYGSDGVPTNNVLNYNYDRNKYSVIVKPNGGVYSSSTSDTTHSNIYYQATYVINNPSRVGYNFSGWTLNGSNSSINGTTFTMGDDNASLTAKWTAKTYTLTLDNQSATSAGSTSVIATYDTNIPNITIPTRTGYVFGGYYTSTNGGGTQYIKADGTSARTWNLDENKVLYAKWTGITYYVKYNANGGSGTMSNQTFTYGTSKKLTTNAFTRNNYIFLGWSKTNTGTVNYNDSATVSNLSTTNGSTVDLYAVWIPTNGYSYAYNGTNGSDGSIQTFKAPATGYYELEVWGAEGTAASVNSTYFEGGTGAYSVGVAKLNAGTTYYIAVGGRAPQASNSTSSGGYNGGGGASTSSTSDFAGPGGGATHIATATGLLSSFSASSNRNKVLIVAGGGGGGYYTFYFNSSGGHAGGVNGGLLRSNYCRGRSVVLGTAASQSAGGTGGGCVDGSFYAAGSFGTGGTYGAWSSGGGAGWFGGGNGYAYGAQGGSSYIGNSLLLSRNNITKSMYCISCVESSDAATKTVSTTNESASAISNYAKRGHGAAKIRWLSAT